MSHWLQPVHLSTNRCVSTAGARTIVSGSSFQEDFLRNQSSSGSACGRTAGSQTSYRSQCLTPRSASWILHLARLRSSELVGRSLLSKRVGQSGNPLDRHWLVKSTKSLALIAVCDCELLERSLRVHRTKLMSSSLDVYVGELRIAQGI